MPIIKNGTVARWRVFQCQVMNFESLRPSTGGKSSRGPSSSSAWWYCGGSYGEFRIGRSKKDKAASPLPNQKLRLTTRWRVCTGLKGVSRSPHPEVLGDRPLDSVQLVHGKGAEFS